MSTERQQNKVERQKLAKFTEQVLLDNRPPLERLQGLVQVLEDVQHQVDLYLLRVRAPRTVDQIGPVASWKQIGDALGLSRSGAQHRWQQAVERDRVRRARAKRAERARN